MPVPAPRVTWFDSTRSLSEMSLSFSGRYSVSAVGDMVRFGGEMGKEGVRGRVIKKGGEGKSRD